MRCCSITSAASTASASARTSRGPRCMTSAAVSARRSAPRSMRRRRSPSVKMPSGRPSSSTTAVKPRPLPVISRSSSLKLAAGAHPRHRVAAAHQVVHVHQQLAAERAAGVRAREVLLAEAARVEQRHRQRVAQRHLRRGAGGGRQVQRAGLLVDGAGQHHVGVAGQRGLGLAGHRHQRHAQAPHRRQDGRQLVALAAVADGQHHVAGHHHAQVAVAGLGRVHEERRRAGRRQRGGDLAADVAALAHAHHDDAAAALQHRLHRAREAFALARRQPQQRARLDLEGALGQAQRAFGVEGARRGSPAGALEYDRAHSRHPWPPPSS